MKTILAKLRSVSPLTWVILGVFIVLMIIALIIGIDSDRGVLMGWLANIVLLIEVTRRWRKDWQFLLLAAGAFLGAILLSGLYEAVIYPLVDKIGGAAAVNSSGMSGFHAVVSDFLLLFVPMTFTFGIMGAVTLFIVRLATLRRKKASE